MNKLFGRLYTPFRWLINGQRRELREHPRKSLLDTIFLIALVAFFTALFHDSRVWQFLLPLNVALLIVRLGVYVDMLRERWRDGGVKR